LFPFFICFSLFYQEPLKLGLKIVISMPSPFFSSLSLYLSIRRFRLSYLSRPASFLCFRFTVLDPVSPLYTCWELRLPRFSPFVLFLLSLLTFPINPFFLISLPPSCVPSPSDSSLLVTPLGYPLPCLFLSYFLSFHSFFFSVRVLPSSPIVTLISLLTFYFLFLYPLFSNFSPSFFFSLFYAFSLLAFP